MTIHLKTYKFKTPQFIVRRFFFSFNLEKIDGYLFQEEQEGREVENLEKGAAEELARCQGWKRAQKE